MENQTQQKNLVWLWWTIGIILAVSLFITMLILSNDEQGTSSIVVNGPRSNSSIPDNNQVSPICTNFEYSDWSSCATDGTQSRTIIKKLPEGCVGGNPVQFQSCKYEPLSPDVTGPVLYKRMVNQIRSAPSQTISTTYIAGEDGGNTTILTWQVKGDGLYMHIKGYRTSDPKDQSSMVLVDTNFDGQPDWLSDRDQPFVAISPSDQYYKEIILSWATFNAYFASYLLK